MNLIELNRALRQLRLGGYCYILVLLGVAVAKLRFPSLDGVAMSPRGASRVVVGADMLIII